MDISDYIVATDASLVELASQGDQQAFEYLFTRYRDALRHLFEQRLSDKEMASIPQGLPPLRQLLPRVHLRPVDIHHRPQYAGGPPAQTHRRRVDR